MYKNLEQKMILESAQCGPEAKSFSLIAVVEA
jgi:hypothetical protein